MNPTLPTSGLPSHSPFPLLLRGLLGDYFQGLFLLWNCSFPFGMYLGQSFSLFLQSLVFRESPSGRLHILKTTQHLPNSPTVPWASESRNYLLGAEGDPQGHPQPREFPHREAASSSCWLPHTHSSTPTSSRPEVSLSSPLFRVLPILPTASFPPSPSHYPKIPLSSVPPSSIAHCLAPCWVIFNIQAIGLRIPCASSLISITSWVLYLLSNTWACLLLPPQTPPQNQL